MINRALMNRQMFANGGAVARSPSDQGEMDAISRDLLRLQREGTTDEVYNFMLKRENSLKQDSRFRSLLESPGYLMFKQNFFQNLREQPRGMQEGGSVAPMGMPPVGGPMVPMGGPPPVGLGPEMGAAMLPGLPEGGAAALEGLLAESQGRLEGMDGAQNYEEMINALRGDQAPLEERREELAGLVGPEDASQTPESVLTLVQPVIMMAEVDQGIGSLPMGDMMSAPVEGNMADGIMTTVNMGAEAPVEGVPAPVNFNQGGAVQYMQPGGVAGFDQLNVRPRYEGALRRVTKNKDRSFTPLTSTVDGSDFGSLPPVGAGDIVEFLRRGAGTVDGSDFGSLPPVGTGDIVEFLRRGADTDEDRERAIDRIARGVGRNVDALGGVARDVGRNVLAEVARGVGRIPRRNVFAEIEDLSRGVNVVGDALGGVARDVDRRAEQVKARQERYIQDLLMRDSSRTRTEDGSEEVVSEVVKGEDGSEEVVKDKGPVKGEGGARGGSTFEAIASGAIPGGDLLSSAEANFPRYLRLIQESLGSDPESRADAAKKAAQSSALFGLSRAAFEYAKSGDFADAAGKGVEALSAATQGLRQEQLALDEQEKALRTAALQGSIDLATSEAKIAADLAKYKIQQSRKARPFRLVLQDARFMIAEAIADPSKAQNLLEIQSAIAEAAQGGLTLGPDGRMVPSSGASAAFLSSQTGIPLEGVRDLLAGHRDIYQVVNKYFLGATTGAPTGAPTGESTREPTGEPVDSQRLGGFSPNVSEQNKIVAETPEGRPITELKELSANIIALGDLLIEAQEGQISPNENAVVSLYSAQSKAPGDIAGASGPSRLVLKPLEGLGNFFKAIAGKNPEQIKDSIRQADVAFGNLKSNIENYYASIAKTYKESDADRLLSPELTAVMELTENMKPSMFNTEQDMVNTLMAVRSNIAIALGRELNRLKVAGVGSPDTFTDLVSSVQIGNELWLRINGVIEQLERREVTPLGGGSTRRQVYDSNQTDRDTTDTADIFN